jgi:hypothetical protein
LLTFQKKVVLFLEIKEEYMSYSKTELCYKCADDGGTLNNMQELIIPMLNDEIEEFKEILRCMHTYSRLPGVRFADEESVKMSREIIIQDIKAISAFYKRFPDLPRTYALKWFKRGTHFRPVGECI